jgi:hypothetical protein
MQTVPHWFYILRKKYLEDAFYSGQVGQKILNLLEAASEPEIIDKSNTIELLLTQMFFHQTLKSCGHLWLKVVTAF